MGGCNAFQFIDCNDAIPVFLPLLSPGFSPVEMAKFLPEQRCMLFLRINKKVRPKNRFEEISVMQ
jgi:hypothetical protein